MSWTPRRTQGEGGLWGEAYSTTMLMMMLVAMFSMTPLLLLLLSAGTSLLLLGCVGLLEARSEVQDGEDENDEEADAEDDADDNARLVVVATVDAGVCNAPRLLGSTSIRGRRDGTACCGLREDCCGTGRRGWACVACGEGGLAAW